MVIFGETGIETGETFGPGFIGVDRGFRETQFGKFWRQGIGELFETLVDFDARDNTLCSEEIDKILTVVGELAGGFVEKNDAVNVIFEIIGGEK